MKTKEVQIMDNNKKTRRIKMMACSAFMMPFMAIGAGLAIRQTPVQIETDAQVLCEEGKRCAASGPMTTFGGYAAFHSHYYEQPDFVGDYFRNLTEYFPTNNCGNCGYTAAAMLLCYYDTYWNGEIIPDQFNSAPAKIGDVSNRDYSSPGINDFAADIKLDEKRKPKKDAPQSEWDAYNVYLVDEVYGPYLYEMRKQEHLKDNLISLLYDLALGNNASQTVLWNFGVNEPTTEINAVMVRNVLNLYFSELGLSDLIEAKMIDTNAFQSTGKPGFRVPEILKRQMLKSAAVSRLKKGQPIIYSGNLMTESGFYDMNQVYNSDAGHFSIAYGYDQENKYIVGHIGWKGEKEYSRVELDKAYGDFNAFVYLDVKPELQFTYPNERYDAGKYVSACDLKPHIHADHDHRAMVCYGDPDYHALQCICGDVEYEEHEHGDPEPYDSQYHALKCVCGDVRYEAHSKDETVFYDGLRHAYKCRCGEIVGYAPHNYIQRSLTTFECKGCGDVMYVAPPFIIDR